MNEFDRIENRFSYPLYWSNIESNVSETIFRSYHILDIVIKMLERDDSKETILELIDFYKNYEKYAPVEASVEGVLEEQGDTK
jgi:hypothetical protein